MCLIPPNHHKSWNDFLSNDIIYLLSKIEKEIGNNHFPLKEEILRFLKVDLTNIKCIIIGMEPYPTDYTENNQTYPIATGRSFEVRNLRDKTWDFKFKQSSLRNILKTIYYNETGDIIELSEIRKKINNNEFLIAQPAEWYDNLEQQGVLFLNAALTVEKYKVNSHPQIWLEFMSRLIKYIETKQTPKWLLWGKDAQNKIIPELNNTLNVITSMHPRLAGFVNENCFQYVKEINWLGK